MTLVIWLERVNLVGAVWAERDRARWLPWWRRYAPVPFQALVVALRLAGGFPRLAVLSASVALVLLIWNGLTARKNRRDKRDHLKLEAESAPLTTVQAAAFRREVARSA